MSDLNKLKEMADKMPCYSHTFNVIIDQLESAQHLADFRGKNITSLNKLIADRDKRIAALESENSQLRQARADLAREANTFEAEIARRDKAAGEPVARVDKSAGRLDYQALKRDLPHGTLLYAAQPAALPPEERDMWRNNLKESGQALSDVRRFVEGKFLMVADMPSTEAVLLKGPECKHEANAIIEALGRVADFYENNGAKALGAQTPMLPPEPTLADEAEALLADIDASTWISGANWMREQVKALGAQPEKIVVLEDVESDAILNAWDYRNMVIAALEAAGVKWKEAE